MRLHLGGGWSGPTGETVTGKSAQDSAGVWRFTAALHRGLDSGYLVLAAITAGTAIIAVVDKDALFQVIISLTVVLVVAGVALFIDYLLTVSRRSAVQDVGRSGSLTFDRVLLAVTIAFVAIATGLFDQVFSNYSPAAFFLFVVLTAAFFLIVQYQLSRRRRGNKFHVTVSFNREDGGNFTGRISWATNWKGNAFLRANVRETPESEWHDLDAQQSSAVLNVLPRLKAMQDVTRGLLRVKGEGTTWTFVCDRGWVEDIVTLIYAVVVGALVALTVLYFAAAGLGFQPVKVSLPVEMLAGGFFVELVALVVAIMAWHRLNLGRQLFLKVQFRTPVAEIEWMEDLHYGPFLAPHKESVTVTNAQGLVKFCELITTMQAKLKLEWEHVDWMLDRPGEVKTASAISVEPFHVAASPV